jgi:hypothetical protein
MLCEDKILSDKTINIFKAILIALEKPLPKDNNSDFLFALSSSFKFFSAN